MARMCMIIFALLAGCAAASSLATVSRERSLADAWSKDLTESDARVAHHKSPVARVVGLLEKMKAALLAEASKEEEMYDKLVCWCETNDKDKTKSIGDSEDKIEQLTVYIKTMTAKKAKIEISIKSSRTVIVTQTLSIKELIGIRDKEKEDYDAEERDLIQYIANLKNAITILGKHYGEFLQVDSPIQASIRAVVSQAALKYELMQGDKVQSPLYSAKRPGAALIAVDEKQSVSEQLKHAWGGDQEEIPVNLAAHLLDQRAKRVTTGSAFMQKAAKAPGYESYSARSSIIFGILKQMLDEFKAKLAQLQKEQIIAGGDFNATYSTKTELSEATKAKIELMLQQSAAIGKLIADAKEALKALGSQRSADSEFIRNVKLTCQDLDRKYEERVKTRGEEIKAISEAIAILTEDDNRDLMRKTVSLVQERSNTDSAAQVRRSRAVAFLWKKARDPDFADDLLAAWSGRTATKSVMPRTNTKLATLAVSVQLDGFGKIKKVMDELVADLKAEQAEEVEFKAQCLKEYATNAKATLAASETKSDIEDQIDALDTKMADLKADIADAKKAIASTEAELKKAGDVREEENADYQKTVADQGATQEILHKALAKLQAFYDKQAALVQNPPAFLQVKSPIMTTPRPIVGGCAGTQYGCCPDGVTPSNADGSACRNIVGGCAGTQFGCCPDGVTSSNSDGTNCESTRPVVGGCAGTQFGCCPDGVTPSNSDGTNCQGRPIVGGCAGTQFGCCPDGVTSSNSDGTNCQSTRPIVGGCAGTQFGCCPDGVTSSNSDGTNCMSIQPVDPSRPVVGGCAGTQFGCCPDGVTASNSDGTNCQGLPQPPVVVEPVEPGSKVPPVTFGKYKSKQGSSPVMSLLEQIIGDSKALVAESKAAEEEAQATYETFVKDSTAVIASLKVSIDDKTRAITKAKEAAAEAKSDLDSTNEELSDLAEHEEILKSKCDWVLKNFDIRQKARQEEMDAITQAKYILSGQK